MTELFLEKSSYSYVTREHTESEWDRDDTSTDWTFGPIYLEKRSNSWSESFLTDFDVKVGDVVYAVVAVWSTGDSFGYDDRAESEVMGSFQTYEEAEKFKLELEHSRCNSYNFDNYELNKPWSGYFESLDYVEVVSGVVT